MRKLLLICALALFIPAQNAFADTPLTDTDFHLAYKDNELINSELREEVSFGTPRWMTIISDPKVDLAVKMAVINKLGWKMTGDNKANQYYEYLVNGFVSDYAAVDYIKIPKSVVALGVMDRDAETMMCIAYMMALDEYQDVKSALDLAMVAKTKDQSGSFTMQMIYGLIEAQDYFLKNEWCSSFQSADKVRKDNSLNKDMKQEAIDIIFEYMDLYEKYCEDDDDKAQNDGAGNFQKGAEAYNKGDLETAVTYFKKSADAGELDGIFIMGTLYMQGIGLEKDMKKGYDLLKQAVDSNFPAAINAMGILYEEGLYVDKDLNLANQHYKKAAQMEFPDAYVSYGRMLAQGVEGEPDYQAAKALFQKGMDAGVPAAFYYMGVLYYSGLGVEKNVEEAKRLFNIGAGMGDQNSIDALQSLEDQ